MRVTGVLSNAYTDERAEPRDEVHHRARITLPDQRTIPALVVNLSPQGMMIRTDADVVVGETITVMLPVMGEVSAVIRWTLGGRIGCQMAIAIPAGRYHAILAAMNGAGGR